MRLRVRRVGVYALSLLSFSILLRAALLALGGSVGWWATQKGNVLQASSPDVASSGNGTEPRDTRPLSLQMWRGEHMVDDVLAAEAPRFLSEYRNPCWMEAGSSPPGVAGGGAGSRARLRCLPYFLLVGADKCGTTDLYDRLLQHPQLLPNGGVGGKETHWWSWRRFGFDIWVRDKPIEHFEDFLQRFDKAAEVIQNRAQLGGDNVTRLPLITGEGSPTTFWDFTGWDLIPQNKGRNPELAYLTPHCIRHLTPNVKIIILLRNPIDRLYSDYLFLDRFRSVHNVSVEGFHRAVVSSLAILDACTARFSLTACLYNKSLHMQLPVRLPVGLYAEYLRVWLSVFPRKQILVMRTEDYSRNVEVHLKQVFDFLQLEAVAPGLLERMSGRGRSNARQSRMSLLGDMWNSTRELLDKFYYSHNQRLSEMLSDGRFGWTGLQ